ncbi:hypothetical protein HY489_03510 [Candidatus Woesearchaeota archaeon]|nr:hypothetical protein [Candidatus Woesearchaeota archaeon]
MDTISQLLLASIVGGVIASILSLYCLRYKAHALVWSPWRAWAVVLFAFGFSLHTFGDYLSVQYGESMERLVESVAHVILLIMIALLLSSYAQIKELAKEYGVK